jgi:hypothetical protein
VLRLGLTAAGHRQGLVMELAPQRETTWAAIWQLRNLDFKAAPGRKVHFDDDPFGQWDMHFIARPWFGGPTPAQVKPPNQTALNGLRPAAGRCYTGGLHSLEGDLPRWLRFARFAVVGRSSVTASATPTM